MRIPLIIAISMGAAGIIVAEREDMLRFSNGDQIHGDFQGVTSGSSISWSRDDMDGVVDFKTEDVRQVILRGGRPDKSLESLSNVGITNGDRIPGIIRGLDDDVVVLETEFGGVLELPREQVGLLAPAPLGGRVLYQGPFNEEGWDMYNSEFPEGFVESIESEEEEKAEEAEADAEVEKWKYTGSAWYWSGNKHGTALTRKTGMPDRSILRFHVAWKSRLSLSIAFQADFSRPEAKDEEEEKKWFQPGQATSLPHLFGNSYVLNFYGTYARMMRSSFDEDGTPRFDSVQTDNRQIRLSESGTAQVELRCNRLTGEILLFVDEEFVGQWSEPGLGAEVGDYAGKGEGFGFVVPNDKTPVRISDVVMAEWNGMPDSARSLQTDDSDIVLLTNGTDRFSGKVKGIENDTLTLESRYGEFLFPMEDVAEVRFAKDGLSEPEENPTLRLRLYPIGRISGDPILGDSETIRLQTTVAGEIGVKLDSAVMLEFQTKESFLDDWDVEF
ncbi:MAG: hypothetical protein ACSHX7_04520 [Luteolibacter sp.]